MMSLTLKDKELATFLDWLIHSKVKEKKNLKVVNNFENKKPDN